MQNQMNYIFFKLQIKGYSDLTKISDSTLHYDKSGTQF